MPIAMLNIMCNGQAAGLKYVIVNSRQEGNMAQDPRARSHISRVSGHYQKSGIVLTKAAFMHAMHSHITFA
jgi:hypothetical protein